MSKEHEEPTKRKKLEELTKEDIAAIQRLSSLEEETAGDIDHGFSIFYNASEAIDHAFGQLMHDIHDNHTALHWNLKFKGSSEKDKNPEAEKIELKKVVKAFYQEAKEQLEKDLVEAKKMCKENRLDESMIRDIEANIQTLEKNVNHFMNKKIIVSSKETSREKAEEFREMAHKIVDLSKNLHHEMEYIIEQKDLESRKEAYENGLFPKDTAYTDKDVEQRISITNRFIENYIAKARSLKGSRYTVTDYRLDRAAASNIAHKYIHRIVKLSSGEQQKMAEDGATRVFEYEKKHPPQNNLDIYPSHAKQAILHDPYMFTGTSDNLYKTNNSEIDKTFGPLNEKEIAMVPHQQYREEYSRLATVSGEISDLRNKRKEHLPNLTEQLQGINSEVVEMDYNHMKIHQQMLKELEEHVSTQKNFLETGERKAVNDALNKAKELFNRYEEVPGKAKSNLHNIYFDLGDQGTMNLVTTTMLYNSQLLDATERLMTLTSRKNRSDIKTYKKEREEAKEAFEKAKQGTPKEQLFKQLLSAAYDAAIESHTDTLGMDVADRLKVQGNNDPYRNAFHQLAVNMKGLDTMNPIEIQEQTNKLGKAIANQVQKEFEDTKENQVRRNELMETKEKSKQYRVQFKYLSPIVDTASTSLEKKPHGERFNALYRDATSKINIFERMQKEQEQLDAQIEKAKADIQEASDKFDKVNEKFEKAVKEALQENKETKNLSKEERQQRSDNLLDTLREDEASKKRENEQPKQHEKKTFSLWERFVNFITTSLGFEPYYTEAKINNSNDDQIKDVNKGRQDDIAKDEPKEKHLNKTQQIPKELKDEGKEIAASTRDAINDLPAETQTTKGEREKEKRKDQNPGSPTLG